MTRWVNIQKHFCFTKKLLQLDNSYFLQITLIWPSPITTLLMYIATRRSIRQLFHITKKLLKSDNHLVRIIRIWLLHATISVWHMRTWVTTRKLFHFMNVLLILENVHYRRTTLIYSSGKGTSKM